MSRLNEREHVQRGAVAAETTAPSRFRPVLSLWALILFGLAFVGVTAPYTYFGIGAAQSDGHFASVYLVALVAVSFTAASYAAMAASYPEAGSAYAYASRAIHPVAGYFTGWFMILDYLLLPMLCVIVVGATSHKLMPAIPYRMWVVGAAAAITAVNVCGIEMTSRATAALNAVLALSIAWFLIASVWALTHGVGRGTLFSWEPFYSAGPFSVKAMMSATPVAVLSFLGFDGISTLAEDARNPRVNVGRATILVCLIAGGMFLLQTYLGQLIWPDYRTFASLETAFSEIGTLIGGPGLGYLIALLVVVQAVVSGIASQASASRLLYGMARGGSLPRPVFGYVHPTLRTPVYSIVLMGVIAATAGMLLSLEKAAELVNFGACVGFMAVNASVVGHYFVRRRERAGAALWRYLISPATGLAICFWIWLSVSTLAMKVGAAWGCVGVVYLVASMRRRGEALHATEREARCTEQKVEGRQR